MAILGASRTTTPVAAANPWEQQIAAEYAKQGQTMTPADLAYWKTNQNPAALVAGFAADKAKAAAAAAGTPTATPTATPRYGLSDISNKYNAQGQPMTQADADYWLKYAETNDATQTGSAMDNAFIYDRSKTVKPPAAAVDPASLLNPFASMLNNMTQQFGQQQTGYQNSMNQLMQSWASMAKPTTEPAAATPTNPYATGDGIGQVSPVYSPTGQNGLNFGWGGSNPFAATF